jgi:predicted nucleotidyltransferase
MHGSGARLAVVSVRNVAADRGTDPRVLNMALNCSTLDPTRLAAIVSHLIGQGQVAAAYLLGSAAEGQLRPDSDVDVAVLPSSTDGLPLAARMSLAAELSRIAGREVDLGVLTTRNLVYAKEAVTRGRLIFDRDHSTTATFEMYTLSMYASLQEARREVLRAYAA